MILFRRFCLSLTVLLAFTETIQSNTDETNSTDIRRGRVNGRIVKLYSGKKPDPIVCLDEGFKADPVDCTVFYRCTKASRGKYAIFRFQCGPGTVYDPETEVCNHPSNTKRTECGGLISSVMREDENNIEDHELPSPINTTASLITNHSELNNTTILSSTTTSKIIEQSTSYRPISTISYPSVVTTEKEYIENSNNLQNYPWLNSNNKTEHEIMSFTTLSPSTDKSFPCTSDGFIGDNKNCRKFYRCVSNSRGGFDRFDFLCSESTIWDDNIQSCNHAWAVRNRRCGRDDFSTRNNTTDKEQSYSVLSQNNEVLNNYEVNANKQQNYNNFDMMDSQYGNKLNYEEHTKRTQYPYSFTTSAYQEALFSNIQDKMYNIHEESDKIKGQNEDTNEINSYYITTPPYYSKDMQQNYTTQTQLYTTQRIHIGKNIQCTQSGFMADTVDCKKFYRCVDNGRGGFTKYEFSCSQETVWDSEIEACNHAWAVKDCGGNISAENSYSEATTKNSITTSTIKENDDIGYLNEINHEQEQTTSTTILTTISLLSTMETSKDSSECTSSGFFGDINDCQKFYRCINNDKGSFTKFDYICGDGTLWDQDIEACNHARAVKTCNQTKITSHTTQQINNYESSPITPISYVHTTTIKNTNTNDDDLGYNNQQIMTTVIPSSETFKTTIRNPQLLPSDCQSNGFVGDTHDCKKFYRCVDNGEGGFNRYEFSCGENTVWDPEINACNHAWAVKQCGGVTDIKQETTSLIADHDLSNGYSTEIYNTLSSSETSSISLQTTLKPTMITDGYSKCDTNGFVGDKLDCKKFYRCVDSGDGKYVQYEFSCGDGTVWDSKIQACNHAWAVEECSNSVHNYTIHDINDTSTKPSTSASYEDENAYITQSTTKFDNLISSTTSSSSATIPTTTINNKQECQSSGFMGDKEDCKIFYRCVDNGNGGFTKHEFSCGPGTAWDSTMEACNHERNVLNCGLQSENVSEKTTASMIQSSIQVTTSYSNNVITEIQQMSTSTEYSSATTLPDVDLPSKDDKCTSEGFFPNNNDCKKFYRCVNDGKGGYNRYDFSCGDGTIWVQEIQSCDHDLNDNNCSYISSSVSTEKNEISSSSDNTVVMNTTDNSENISHHNQSNQNLNNNTSATQNEQDESDTNMSTTKITTSKPTTESTKPTSTNECKQEGYFGNTGDCKKFYRCVSNEKGDFTKYDFSCGEGTIWDQDITACNHPRDVTNPSCATDQEVMSTTMSSSSENTSENNVMLPESTSSSSSTSTESAANQNETDSNSSNEVGSDKNTDDKNIVCKKAGFYANPNDCKKFYRCVDWDNNGEKFSVFHFECGEGTIWDPSLDTCNHIDSVYPPRMCNGTVQQTGNMTDSSSTTENISTTTNQYETSTTSELDSTTQKTTTQQTTTQQQSTAEQQSTTHQQSTTEQLQSTTEQQSTVQQQTSTDQQLTTQQQTTTEQQQTTQQQTTTEQQLTTQQQTTTEQPSTTPQSSTSIETTPQSTTEASTTLKSTTQQATTVTESDQTTTQTTNEPTTKASTKGTTPKEETTVSESTTAEFTDQSSTTEQAMASTQPLTTEESTTSQTEAQSSTTETSTTENEHQSSTESNASNPECPETDEDQFVLVCPTSFKRHPKYCNIFYQCTEDNESHEMKVASFNCPNNTIYDESKVQCVEEDKSEKKCNGQIAQKHRVKRLGISNSEPIFVTKRSMACPNVGHFPFEKHDECSSAILKCELTKSGKLRGYIYKCPEGFVYWSVSRRCESLRKLIDCKKSTDKWSKRYDIPVEKYNVAH